MKAALNVLGIFLLAATLMAGLVAGVTQNPDAQENELNDHIRQIYPQLAPAYAQLAATADNVMRHIFAQSDYDRLNDDFSRCIDERNALKKQREEWFSESLLIGTPLAVFTLLSFVLARRFKPSGSPSLPASDTTPSRPPPAR